MRKPKSRLLGGAFATAAAAALLVMGAVAFACTTFQGKLTITTNGGTSVSQGDNNCGHTGGCGAANGSMTYCGTPTLAATEPHATGGSATISMGTTTSCSAGNGQNHLAGNVTYDITLRNVDSMSSSDVSIQDSEDCMSSILVATAVADANGAFTKVITLPSGPANGSGWYSGLCVQSHDVSYGNMGGIRYS